ncbi:hypothetical protein BJX61DRAFT_306214 [Aspergillus egyptiacus]|nr:hypothetical protein BJX61DRAFT_306214 [Aspergillus egyptiacus]
MSDQQKRGSSDEIPPRNPRPSAENSDEAPANSNRDSQGAQSLATRIQNSASGLARNAFLSSGSSGDTAHLLSDGGKAAPSSSSTSALAAAEQYRQSSGAPSTSSRDQINYGSGDTFRSASAAQTRGFELPGLTEEEFQNQYGGGLSDNMDVIDRGKGKAKAREINPQSAEHNLYDTQTAASVSSDGDAVVSLLANPTFDPAFPPQPNEPPEYLDTELAPPQLTQAEMQMIESFRRELPAEPQSQQTQNHPHQLNPSSLVPDIGSFLDTLPASNSSTSAATSLRDTVLTSLPGAAEWISVEEKYHDEVWGYLQPTLEAAAKEIESTKDSPESTEGPAVRRLKMILRHMQH